MSRKKPRCKVRSPCWSSITSRPTATASWTCATWRKDGFFNSTADERPDLENINTPLFTFSARRHGPEPSLRALNVNRGNRGSLLQPLVPGAAGLDQLGAQE